MNISFSKDFGKIKFDIDPENEEQDFSRCAKIEKLLQYPEWAELLQVYEKMHEKYQEAVLSVKPTDVSAREVQVYAARMSGFMQAIGVAKQIVDAYHVRRAEHISELERSLNEKISPELSFVEA